MSAPESGLGPARARLFRLLARIMADGLSPALRAAFGALPELADLLGAERSEDEDAADHQDLFGFRVPPFAGVFLDDGLRIGGPATDAVLGQYAMAGFDRIRDDLGPDHLATELAFLAHCAERGADDVARTFLDGHALGWLPALVAAVRRESFDAYVGLTAVLHESVLEYRASLGGDPVRPPEPEPFDDLLSRQETGVRDIARYLAIPARSGLFLGRGDVARLGRETGSPRGFGGRVLMLTNLLRSAAEYDRLDDLVTGLDGIAVQTAAVWTTTGATGVGAVSAWASIWTVRIERTRSMLSELVRRVRDASDDSGRNQS